MARRSLRRAAALALRPRRARGTLRALSALPQEKPFYYQDLFAQPNKVEVPYRKLEGSENWVSSVQGPGGDNFLIVDPEALTALTVEAMSDIAFLCVLCSAVFHRVLHVLCAGYGQLIWRNWRRSSETKRRRRTIASWRWSC